MESQRLKDKLSICTDDEKLEFFPRTSFLGSFCEVLDLETFECRDYEEKNGVLIARDTTVYKYKSRNDYLDCNWS